MASQKVSQLLSGHPDDGKDVPQCALRHIAARVDGHDHSAAIRMAHYVVAPIHADEFESGALQGLHHVRPGHRRDWACH